VALADDRARRALREFQLADQATVAEVWHRSGQASYTYIPTWQEFSLEKAREVFAEQIIPRCTIWVGTMDERIVAFLAMSNSYMDRLYVDPPEWRKGWGTRFVNFAKQVSPTGLELHTHQENHAARSLYERHGFRAVAFGLSPAPELIPDVEYHWRPDAVRGQG
jgi:GNAT superfamily N-acetyltransferase